MQTEATAYEAFETAHAAFKADPSEDNRKRLVEALNAWGEVARQLLKTA